MGMLSLLTENPLIFVFVAVALVICISIHEFAHAWVAHLLGDDTAKHLGRVTLNPLSHLDPVGTMFLLIAGFGWGRPVPFNPYNLKNPKRDSALIALAGPVSNFLLAIVLAILYYFFSGSLFISVFLYFTILYNLVLGVFNLIPVHPLDGFKIVNGVLPESLSIQWMQMAPFGIFILLALVFTGATGKIIFPVITLFMSFLGLPT